MATAGEAKWDRMKGDSWDTCHRSIRYKTIGGGLTNIFLFFFSQKIG